jgi:hypothetical protein
MYVLKHLALTPYYIKMQDNLSQSKSIKVVFIPGLATANLPPTDSLLISLTNMCSVFHAISFPSIPEYFEINDKKIQYNLLQNAGINLIPFKVRTVYMYYSIYVTIINFFLFLGHKHTNSGFTS